MAQLLSNLPIGAKVKFGKHSINGETALPITWVVVAKNHTGALLLALYFSPDRLCHPKANSLPYVISLSNSNLSQQILICAPAMNFG